MKIEDFVNQSIENRVEFLKPYKAKFDALDPKKNRRKRARIIIELLQREPSHIDEPWIRRQVVDWMRDPAAPEHLAAAFKTPTAKQKFIPIRDAMVFGRVEALKKQGLTVRKACEKLAGQFHGRDAKTVLMWDMTDSNLDLAEAIRNAYYKHRERLKGDVPRPYYGSDISDISVKPHET